MSGRFGLVGLLLLLPCPAPAATEWRVDPARSSLSIVFEQGGMPVTAAFVTFSAAVSFDPARRSHRRVRVAHLPNPIGPNAALESVMAFVHGTLAVLLGLLLVLHVAAALRHHFVLRDDVLERMLPGRRGWRA